MSNRRVIAVREYSEAFSSIYRASVHLAMQDPTWNVRVFVEYWWEDKPVDRPDRRATRSVRLPSNRKEYLAMNSIWLAQYVCRALGKTQVGHARKAGKNEAVVQGYTTFSNQLHILKRKIISTWRWKRECGQRSHDLVRRVDAPSRKIYLCTRKKAAFFKLLVRKFSRNSAVLLQRCNRFWKQVES